MRLNPAKCLFGVQAQNFLGFMLIKRGIEVNSEKFKFIIDMRSRSNVNDVQQLTRHLSMRPYVKTTYLYPTLSLLQDEHTYIKYHNQCLFRDHYGQRPKLLKSIIFRDMKEFNPLDQTPPSRHSSQEILQCRGRSPRRRKKKKKAQEPIVYFDSDADDECDVD